MNNADCCVRGRQFIKWRLADHADGPEEDGWCMDIGGGWRLNVTCCPWCGKKLEGDKSEATDEVSANMEEVIYKSIQHAVEIAVLQMEERMNTHPSEYLRNLTREFKAVQGLSVVTASAVAELERQKYGRATIPCEMVRLAQQGAAREKPTDKEEGK
jgi:hypothetical protein